MSGWLSWGQTVGGVCRQSQGRHIGLRLAGHEEQQMVAGRGQQKAPSLEGGKPGKTAKSKLA